MGKFVRVGSMHILFSCLLTLAFLAASPQGYAQSPYALIGNELQSAGPKTWTDDASRSEAFGAIMSAWAAEDGFSGTFAVSFDGEQDDFGAVGYADYETRRAMSVDTPMRAGFLSRYFTLAAAIRLAEKGKFSEDAPIGDYVPGLRADISVTPVRHYLRMKSGLDQDIFKYTDKSYASDFGARDALPTAINQVNRIYDAGVEYRGFGPDGSLVDYMLIGLLLEQVTGKKLEEVVRSEVITPLELTNTGFLGESAPPAIAVSYHELFSNKERYEPPHHSYVFASGGVYSTIFDVFTFFSETMQRGALGDGVQNMFMTYDFVTEFAVEDGAFLVGDQIPDSATAYSTFGDNGWMRGETIMVQYFKPDDAVVLILSNVHRASEVYDMRRRFARLKFDLPVGAPLPKVRKKLWSLLLSEGPVAAYEFFASETAQGSGADLPWPDQFMHHSRELRAQSRYAEAIAVTELYILTQPDFYLPYREMGEIYRVMGDRETAVRYFQQSLSREPDDIVFMSAMEAYVAGDDK